MCADNYKRGGGGYRQDPEDFRTKHSDGHLKHLVHPITDTRTTWSQG